METGIYYKSKYNNQTDWRNRCFNVKIPGTNAIVKVYRITNSYSPGSLLDVGKKASVFMIQN